MLDATEALPLILGPDKRNPSFCLYTDAPEKELHVYYGLELLAVVPNDRDSPAYRLLAARLYNAGVRVATLAAVFGLDRKTMRNWGLALRSGDRDWLAEVLTGRWRPAEIHRGDGELRAHTLAGPARRARLSAALAGGVGTSVRGQGVGGNAAPVLAAIA